MMYSMFGIEYEKVEINVARVEKWWSIVTIKVIVHNERVFLLLHNAHSSTCSLQERNDISLYYIEDNQLKRSCHSCHVSNLQ